jgi:hypothetical protein
MFSPLFDELDYLTLLNLPPAASSAVLSISNLIGQNPNHQEDVLALLRAPDWRLHLIAAVAVLLSPVRDALYPALWDAVDSGSWVSPQLAVVLAICDPEFVDGAKQRILAGCPVVPHTLAAFLHLVRTFPDEARWAETIVHTPEVAHVLQSDRDASGVLAARWAAALQERFADLGLSLSQRAG